MDDPVILITGALTGIGRAVAVAFAKKGAKVVVAGRRDEAGRALADELRSLGAEAEFINADVRNEDDVRSLIDQTVARFGRLDVAVNNAGTEGKPGPLSQHSGKNYPVSRCLGLGNGGIGQGLCCVVALGPEQRHHGARVSKRTAWQPGGIAWLRPWLRASGESPEYEVGHLVGGLVDQCSYIRCRGQALARDRLPPAPHEQGEGPVGHS